MPRRSKGGPRAETAATTPHQRPVVVALGASAGGLAALSRFFEAMPADSGMAFVVVQHLDPEPGEGARRRARAS